MRCVICGSKTNKKYCSDECEETTFTYTYPQKLIGRVVHEISTLNHHYQQIPDQGFANIENRINEAMKVKVSLLSKALSERGLEFAMFYANSEKRGFHEAYSMITKNYDSIKKNSVKRHILEGA